MTAGLKDMSRDLEPEYSGSPYYPNVVPTRRTRVTATYSGQALTLFDGYIETFPLSWASYRYNQIQLSAFDALAPFANWPISGFLPAQATGARVHALLNKVGWSDAARSIDGGTCVMREKQVADQSLLSLLQECSDTEDGVFFINTVGTATFHDANHRTTAPRSVSPAAVYGNSALSTGQLPYLTAEPSYDVNRVANYVELSYFNPINGQQTSTSASDIPSQFRHGRRPYQRATELFDPAVALTKAAGILARLKDPHVRFDTMTVEPKRAAALWILTLDLTISDRITVVHNSYVGGAALTKDCFVEHVAHSITTGDNMSWRTTYTLSPV